MTAHDAVVAALGEHSLGYGSKGGRAFMWFCSGCDWTSPHSELLSERDILPEHRAHLASVLAPLFAAERAAALREAADDCRELGGGTWDWTVLASRADSISTTPPPKGTNHE